MGLTAKEIEAARPGIGPERMSDGNGLYVRVYRSGRKAFQARLDENGKTRWLTLGTFPDMALKEARRAAALARAGAVPEDLPVSAISEKPAPEVTSAVHGTDAPDMPTLFSSSLSRYSAGRRRRWDGRSRVCAGAWRPVQRDAHAHNGKIVTDRVDELWSSLILLKCPVSGHPVRFSPPRKRGAVKGVTAGKGRKQTTIHRRIVGGIRFP